MITAIGDFNITEAFDKVGKEGVITVEEAKGTDTYVDVVEGMQFDRGLYISLFCYQMLIKWITESGKSITYLLIDKKISNYDKRCFQYLETVCSIRQDLF